MKPFVSFPPLVIRPASPDDAALLRLIYAPYIQETAITFEKTVPSLKEFQKWIVLLSNILTLSVRKPRGSCGLYLPTHLIPDLLTATVQRPASM